MNQPNSKNGGKLIVFYDKNRTKKQETLNIYKGLIDDIY